MSASHRPKIVYILPAYDPDTASHFFHLYELVRGAAGHLDIRVIIERARGDPAGLGVPVYVQRFSLPPLRFIELLAVLLRERIRGRRFFYAHYSFYGALASWMITRLFGGTVYYWNAGMPWLYRRSRLEEAVFRFILRHTVLVTGTAGLAAEYARRYRLRRDRIGAMPNWVSTDRFQTSERNHDRTYIREKLRIPMEAKVALFVHRLSRRKGAHLLPEIISGVTKRTRDVIFVVVGDGPERRNLERGVGAQGMGDRVRIVGEVAQRDIAPYFRTADAFLMPSEEEGFPHVLLEAMAAGLPYVASDVGGVAEVTPLALRPYLVPSGDTARFIGRILDVLALPPSERTAIAAEERAWAEQYDIRRALLRFKALFR